MLLTRSTVFTAPGTDAFKPTRVKNARFSSCRSVAVMKEGACEIDLTVRAGGSATGQARRQDEVVRTYEVRVLPVLLLL